MTQRSHQQRGSCATANAWYPSLLTERSHATTAPSMRTPRLRNVPGVDRERKPRGLSDSAGPGGIRLHVLPLPGLLCDVAMAATTSIDSQCWRPTTVDSR